MSITRAQAETELISRLGKKLTLVGLDGTTVDGTNTDLSGALAVAARGVGITLASPFTVTDAELSAVDDPDEFMYRAELRVWENIVGSLNLVDSAIGTHKEAWGQLAAQAEKAIERLTLKMQIRYGDGVGTLEAGVISLDFQTKFDDEVSSAD